MCVYTINGELEIWEEFWETTDDKTLKRILNHDFSKFDYRVLISQNEEL